MRLYASAIFSLNSCFYSSESNSIIKVDSTLSTATDFSTNSKDIKSDYTYEKITNSLSNLNSDEFQTESTYGEIKKGSTTQTKESSSVISDSTLNEEDKSNKEYSSLYSTDIEKNENSESNSFQTEDILISNSIKSEENTELDDTNEIIHNSSSDIDEKAHTSGAITDSNNYENMESTNLMTNSNTNEIKDNSEFTYDSRINKDDTSKEKLIGTTNMPKDSSDFISDSYFDSSRDSSIISESIQNTKDIKKDYSTEIMSQSNSNIIDKLNLIHIQIL